MDTLICPICKENDLKSRITVGMTITTALHVNSYYDENGNFHIHDHNKSTTSYNCSNGHKFLIITRNPCPSYPNNCTHEGERIVEFK